MDIRFTLNQDGELTPAQIAEIEASRGLPFVEDEDSPEIDPEKNPELWAKALEAQSEKGAGYGIANRLDERLSVRAGCALLSVLFCFVSILIHIANVSAEYAVYRVIAFVCGNQPTQVEFIRAAHAV